MTTTADRIAARTVSGVMAAMVAATAAATAVGFWLSYHGLHAFAVRAGMAGAEAWAWPASVDLFIVAGEAGVTISALRRERDSGAWVYLVLGFALSVTGNILHVHPGQLPWAPYAVAAVPPMAAMAALAALLRIVYRLAIDRAAREDTPATVTARAAATVRSGERAYSAALSASDRARAADTKRSEKAARERAGRPRRAVSGRRPARPKGTGKQAAIAALLAEPDMTAEALSERFSVSGRTGRRYREEAREMAASAASNGG
jgi:Protein of unknown function (DUF2637)